MRLLLAKLIDLFDWELVTLVVIINVIGITAIYSASQNYGQDTQYYLKQLVWFIVGLVLMTFVSLMRFSWLMKFAYIAHIGVIILLAVTLTHGSGSRLSDVNRWLSIGPFFIQPSEFAKFSLVLALAAYFKENIKIGTLKWIDILITGAMTFVPVLMIFKQPDFGTAMVLIIIYAVCIFIMGLNYKLILGVFAATLLSAPLIWQVMKPYQRDRIITMFNPEGDPLGKGYHLIQSKIAIGSGGISGKGFLEGKQAQLNFLPAKHTDFIFSLFSEEWGFVGSIFLVVLYYIFLYKCLGFIKKCGSRAGAVICAGVTAIFFTHIVINICMVMGLLPVVGIPLPFFSYGGSSMLSMMVGLGMVMNSMRNSRHS